MKIDYPLPLYSLEGITNKICICWFTDYVHPTNYAHLELG